MLLFSPDMLLPRLMRGADFMVSLLKSFRWWWCWPYMECKESHKSWDGILLLAWWHPWVLELSNKLILLFFRTFNCKAYELIFIYSLVKLK
jgi:hypothetical protein